MRGIPEDIWEAAGAIAKLAHVDGSDPEPIAAAILAERQRCADTARRAKRNSNRWSCRWLRSS